MAVRSIHILKRWRDLNLDQVLSAVRATRCSPGMGDDLLGYDDALKVLKLLQIPTREAVAWLKEREAECRYQLPLDKYVLPKKNVSAFLRDHHNPGKVVLNSIDHAQPQTTQALKGRKAYFEKLAHFLNQHLNDPEFSNVQQDLAKYAETLRFKSEELEAHGGFDPFTDETSFLVQRLSQHAEKFSGLLHLLAREDHASALQAFANLVIQLTIGLNDLAERNRDAFDAVTAEHTTWPVLFSPVGNFDSYARKLLSKLGNKTNLRVDSNTKRNPNDYGTMVAESLIIYLKDAHDQILHLAREHSFLPNEIQPLLAREIANLGSLTPDTVPEWWKLAKSVLKSAYPDPMLEPDLRTLVRSARGKRAALVNAKIVETIRGKFKSLVSKAPY